MIDLTGSIFDRWSVLKRAPNKASGQTAWFCKCICGIEKVVQGRTLKNGESKSCGCLAREKSTIHGLRSHGLYRTWRDMNRRCFDIDHINYPTYGGRGITVCEEWRKDKGPTAFIRYCVEELKWIQALKDKGKTLDRYPDTNGDYEPGNTRFATQSEQLINTNTSKVNTSSRRGVTWHKGGNKWQAQLMLNGKHLYLGLLSKFEAAVKARVAAEIKYYGRELYLEG